MRTRPGAGLITTLIVLPIAMIMVGSVTATLLPKGDPVRDVAAWLGEELDCEVDVVRTPGAQAVTSVTLTRASGDITLARPSGKVAILSQPQQPDHRIALPVRQLHECIAEELRRLDEDEMYGDVLTQGLRRVAS